MRRYNQGKNTEKYKLDPFWSVVTFSACFALFLIVPFSSGRTWTLTSVSVENRLTSTCRKPLLWLYLLLMLWRDSFLLEAFMNPSRWAKLANVVSPTWLVCMCLWGMCVGACVCVCVYLLKNPRYLWCPKGFVGNFKGQNLVLWLESEKGYG